VIRVTRCSKSKMIVFGCAGWVGEIVARTRAARFVRSTATGRLAVRPASTSGGHSYRVLIAAPYQVGQ
jgi:hypothetical protein